MRIMGGHFLFISLFFLSRESHAPDLSSVGDTMPVTACYQKKLIEIETPKFFLKLSII